jgi:hypothetical protein
VYLWGVDIGEAKLDLAVEPLTGGAPRFFHLPPLGRRSPERFHELSYRVRRFARPIAEQLAPALIVVEQPVGHFPNPWLTGAWGVILGALTVFDAPVWTETPRNWADRLGIKSGKANVMAWAEREGIEVENDHQADAVGILRSTRVVLARDVAWRERIRVAG